MFPNDPLRQKMLYRTEQRTIGAIGSDPGLLAQSMNAAYDKLGADGFSVQGTTPCPGGMLVTGQRIVPVNTDPTPSGVPMPGTNATQSLEIAYTFIEDGQRKIQVCASLQDAVRTASHDLQSRRQPLSIHVTSTTVYSTGDLHVLRQTMG